MTKKQEDYVKYSGVINRYKRDAQINRYNRATVRVCWKKYASLMASSFLEKWL